MSKGLDDEHSERFFLMPDGIATSDLEAARCACDFTSAWVESLLPKPVRKKLTWKEGPEQVFSRA